MATSTFSLFLISLSLIALTASARPCKTLFFFTTTTTSFPQKPDPNFEIFPSQNFRHDSPKFLTFSLSTVNSREENNPYISYFSLRRTPEERKFFDDEAAAVEIERSVGDSVMPLEIYSSETMNLIRDRAEDIMSFMGTWLFDFGCGSLIALTMFLIWYLFYPQRFDFDDSDGYDNGDNDDGDDDEDVRRFKKGGYIAIPEDVDAIKKGFAAQKEQV